jgi:hypothetical protein
VYILQLVAALLALIYPGLMLIDYGHFQYLFQLLMCIIILAAYDALIVFERQAKTDGRTVKPVGFTRAWR